MQLMLLTDLAAIASVSGEWQIERNMITWTYKADSQGGPVTFVCKGTVDSAEKMSGTVTAVEFSIEGEFTATRSK